MDEHRDPDGLERSDAARDEVGDQQPEASRGSRNTILLIGIAFFGILMCMCLSVLALVAV